jgi:hypothetical protein
LGGSPVQDGPLAFTPTAPLAAFDDRLGGQHLLPAAQMTDRSRLATGLIEDFRGGQATALLHHPHPQIEILRDAEFRSVTAYAVS